MKRMYERGITVEVRNEKEEQDFLECCDKYEADRVGESWKMADGIKDETAYRGGLSGEPIFPIYYHFDGIGGNGITWDVEKESFSKTQLIGFEKFKECINYYEKFEESMAG